MSKIDVNESMANGRNTSIAYQVSFLYRGNKTMAATYTTDEYGNKSVFVGNSERSADDPPNRKLGAYIALVRMVADMLVGDPSKLTHGTLQSMFEAVRSEEGYGRYSAIENAVDVDFWGITNLAARFLAERAGRNGSKRTAYNFVTRNMSKFDKAVEWVDYSFRPDDSVVAFSAQQVADFLMQDLSKEPEKSEEIVWLKHSWHTSREWIIALDIFNEIVRDNYGTLKYSDAKKMLERFRAFWHVNKEYKLTAELYVDEMKAIIKEDEYSDVVVRFELLDNEVFIEAYNLETNKGMADSFAMKKNALVVSTRDILELDKDEKSESIRQWLETNVFASMYGVSSNEADFLDSVRYVDASKFLDQTFNGDNLFTSGGIFFTSAD